jgi:hypothetical protein
MLSERRPFPPGHSPWRYGPQSPHYDNRLLAQFSMANVLFVLSLTGGIIGWWLTRPVPLFPNWLGAIGGASLLGYSATFLDGRGDLFRFLGHTLLAVIGALLRIADESRLRDNTQKILGQIFFFLRGLDDQFHIIQQLQLVLAAIIVRVTAVIHSMRREQQSSPASRYGPQRRPEDGSFDDYRDDEFQDERQEWGRGR